MSRPRLGSSRSGTRRSQAFGTLQLSKISTVEDSKHHWFADPPFLKAGLRPNSPLAGDLSLRFVRSQTECNWRPAGEQRNGTMTGIWQQRCSTAAADQARCDAVLSRGRSGSCTRQENPCAASPSKQYVSQARLSVKHLTWSSQTGNV